MDLTRPPTTWSEGELAAGRAAYPQDGSYQLGFSSANPTPGEKDALLCAYLHPPRCPPTVSDPRLSAHTCIGTGRTGFLPVAPNNFPFYSADEVYQPVLQSDGGQLSGASLLLGLRINPARAHTAHQSNLPCVCSLWPAAAEWQPMYQPGKDHAEADRAAAYAAGVPHGEGQLAMPEAAVSLSVMCARCRLHQLPGCLRNTCLCVQHYKAAVARRICCSRR